MTIDTTVVSAFTAKNEARDRQAEQALREAKRTKETKYRELLSSNRRHLLVMAFEVAGRWNQDSIDFLRMLAWFRSQSSPRLLRRSLQALLLQR